MTNKLIGVALFAVLLTLAPLAAAEADSGNTTSDGSERPDDAAWVEDCPPDMMCAFSDEPKEDNLTRGEECEYCRDHQDQDCVDCLGAPGSDDNTTWGTDCPPGVFCMSDGETEDPDDDGWVDCDGEVCAYGDGIADSGPATEGDAATAEASALAAYAFLGSVGLVGLAFVASLRRD